MKREERGILDRREGDWAVVHLGGAPLELPRWMVPDAVRDGEALSFRTEERGGIVTVEVRAAGRAEAERAAGLIERLRGRPPG